MRWRVVKLQHHLVVLAVFLPVLALAGQQKEDGRRALDSPDEAQLNFGVGVPVLTRDAEGELASGKYASFEYVVDKELSLSVTLSNVNIDSSPYDSYINKNNYKGRTDQDLVDFVIRKSVGVGGLYVGGGAGLMRVKQHYFNEAQADVSSSSLFAPVFVEAGILAGKRVKFYFSGGLSTDELGLGSIKLVSRSDKTDQIKNSAHRKTAQSQLATLSKYSRLSIGAEWVARGKYAYLGSIAIGLVHYKKFGEFD